MTKYSKYQDYVIKNGKFIGEFEEMYRDFDDPWNQKKIEIHKEEKKICLEFIKNSNFKKIIEFGCGLGSFTNQISRYCNNLTGIDISETAIKKAKKSYPHIKFRIGRFPDLEFLKDFNPDCILMPEITWYVLEELDQLISFLKKQMPQTFLVHTLMVYKKETQNYGKSSFTNLEEILSYFDMNYVDYGKFESEDNDGSGRTFFIGRYGKI